MLRRRRTIARGKPRRCISDAEFVTPQLLVYIGIITVVFFGLQIGAAVMVYAERKVSAFMQQRMGPFLVGPRGLLQPIADIVKLIFKEDLRPEGGRCGVLPGGAGDLGGGGVRRLCTGAVRRGDDVLRPAR